MIFPNAKKKLYSKLYLHSIHSLQYFVSERRFVERIPPSRIFMRDSGKKNQTKAILRSKGKDKRQIASLLTPTCTYGQAGIPAYPSTINGVYFILLPLSPKA
jgi:hypothetical protein